jgi:hypothetical protein
MSSVTTKGLLVTSFFLLSFFFLVTVWALVTSGASEERLPGDSSLDFFLLASELGGEPLEVPGLGSWPPEEAAAVSGRAGGGEDLEAWWVRALSSFRPPLSALL